MKRKLIVGALAVVVLLAGAMAWTIARPRHGVNAGADGLMLDGFDPVTYFPDGGGVPRPGLPDVTAVHEGRRYRFASDAHRGLFQAAPGKYEPQYGGWCAHAVANGYKFEADPESWLVHDGRLLVFYRGFLGDARAEFEKAGSAEGVRKADANWPALR